MIPGRKTARARPDRIVEPNRRADRPFAAGLSITGLGCIRRDAALLEATSYSDACPIATMALEVASTNEPLRAATAEVFSGWADAVTARLVTAGVGEGDARRLAFTVIALLEGGFLLCRATKSTEPLLAAGHTAMTAARQAAQPQTRSLDDRPGL
jgi:hypothetical protein